MIPGWRRRHPSGLPHTDQCPLPTCCSLQAARWGGVGGRNAAAGRSCNSEGNRDTNRTAKMQQLWVSDWAWGPRCGGGCSHSPRGLPVCGCTPDPPPAGGEGARGAELALACRFQKVEPRPAAGGREVEDPVDSRAMRGLLEVQGRQQRVSCCGSMLAGRPTHGSTADTWTAAGSGQREGRALTCARAWLEGAAPKAEVQVREEVGIGACSMGATQAGKWAGRQASNYRQQAALPHPTPHTIPPAPRKAWQPSPAQPTQESTAAPPSAHLPRGAGRGPAPSLR